MRLEKIHLLNFKNYEAADVELKGQIHCFLGRNGSGKTNLLEAIYYLSFTRGTTANPDAANIRHGADLFLIRGVFQLKEKRKEVTCSFSPERKKKVAEDGKEYGRFSEHIGKYPLVIVAPGDIELVWDGGAVRRKFMDTLLSQMNKEYLEQLMIYQTHLRHRNGLLKMYAERAVVDKELLATYDDRLVAAGTYLHKQRKELLNRLVPRVEEHYSFLVSGGDERPGIEYESDLDTLDFRKELLVRLDRDIAVGRTTIGIHRDDFRFTLQGYELKSYGSQGQQKSFLIALKLAEFDCLFQKNGFKPLLLLDDIFDKLDDDRILRLMQLIMKGTFGQILITDARPGRSLDVLREAGVNSQNFEVNNGSLVVLP